MALCPGTARGQTNGWRFLVFGDTLQTSYTEPINTSLVTELAAAITNEHPAFVLVLGDLAFGGGQPALEQWTNLMAPVWQAGIGVYPLVGNHESDVSALTNVFGPLPPTNGRAGDPGTYAFGWSNALFVLFNEFVPGNEYRVNQAWLDSLLATNTRPHVFAAGHTLAFKLLHTDCLGSYPANRDCFWNSLSNAHCRVYFCGHDHFYDHARLDDGDGDPDNDLHQMTVGTGGALLFADGAYDGTNDLWTPIRLFHEPEYGYVLVEIDGERVTSTWHHRTAPGAFPATAEVFSYSVTRRPVLQFEVAGGTLTLKWPGTASLQAAPDPSGPFADIAGAASPYSVSSTAASQMFYRLVLPASAN